MTKLSYNLFILFYKLPIISLTNKYTNETFKE